MKSFSLSVEPASSLPYGSKLLYDLLNDNEWYKKTQALKASNLGISINANESDKGGWRYYNRVYSKYLEEIKEEPINLLEMGVHGAFSILAWSKYFTNGSIYGMEIDTRYVRLYNDIINQNKNVKNLFFMDVTNIDLWKKNVPKNLQFDVIIDDASHVPRQQISTFSIAWKHLKKGGLYFIEDISSIYGPNLKLVWNLLGLISEKNYVKVYSHYSPYLDNLNFNLKLREIRNVAKGKTFTPYEFIAVIRKKEENDS